MIGLMSGTPRPNGKKLGIVAGLLTFSLARDPAFPDASSGMSGSRKLITAAGAVHEFGHKATARDSLFTRCVWQREPSMQAV